MIRSDVVHDALLALETAFGSGSGRVVIAGTGSVGLARTCDGTLERVGGWGHRLGDPGSGYALGQAGLRAVAEALEGGPDTSLRAAVQQRLDIPDRDALINTVYEDGAALQDVAPLVCAAAAADDPVATRILTRQTRRLGRQIEWLVDRCASLTPWMALLGGLIQDETYTEALRDVLADRFPAWSIDPLREDPVVGALQRARRRATAS